jgi:protein-tyrosine phosphatase
MRLPRFTFVLALLAVAGCSAPVTDDAAASNDAITESTDAPKPGARIAAGGTINMRDLGGYATADGRRVARGVAFRSDQLTKLDDDGLRVVRGLDLVAIADFRADSERHDHGLDKTPGIRGERFAIDDPQAAVVGRFNAALENGDLQTIGDLFGDGRGRALMIKGYENFVNDDTASAQFSKLAKEIAQGRGPVMFHCVSGKDRTGFMAAILLRAVGVPMETVMSDYLLSNVYRKDFVDGFVNPFTDEVLDGAGYKGDKESFRAGLRAVLGVDRAYLEASFRAIERRYGSFGAYLKAIGVDVHALRDVLLAE